MFDYAAAERKKQKKNKSDSWQPSEKSERTAFSPMDVNIYEPSAVRFNFADIPIFDPTSPLHGKTAAGPTVEKNSVLFVAPAAVTEQKSEVKPVQMQPDAEKAPNLTGIPDDLKAKFERKSGFSFNNVRVFYNSDDPARVGALAYTQGNRVFIGPEQEKRLPHELGHVVQQKQGRVKPNGNIDGLPVNDNEQLEAEAEKGFFQETIPSTNITNVIQRVIVKGADEAHLWDTEASPEDQETTINELGDDVIDLLVKIGALEQTDATEDAIRQICAILAKKNADHSAVANLGDMFVGKDGADPVSGTGPARPEFAAPAPPAATEDTAAFLDFDDVPADEDDRGDVADADISSLSEGEAIEDDEVDDQKTAASPESAPPAKRPHRPEYGNAWKTLPDEYARFMQRPTDPTTISTPYGPTMAGYTVRGPYVTSRAENFSDAKVGPRYTDLIKSLKTSGLPDDVIARELLTPTDEVFKTPEVKRAAAMTLSVVNLAEEQRKQGAAKIFRATLRTMENGTKSLDDMPRLFAFAKPKGGAQQGRLQVAAIKAVQEGHMLKSELPSDWRVVSEQMSPVQSGEWDTDPEIREDYKSFTGSVRNPKKMKTQRILSPEEIPAALQKEKAKKEKQEARKRKGRSQD